MLIISDYARAGIIDDEISSPAYYERTEKWITWPQGDSGLTAGIGYDLGYCTVADFRADWSDHLDAETMGRLVLVVGLTGTHARDALHTVSDIAIPLDAALRVFDERNIPRAIQQCVGALPNCDLLSPDSLGALVSLVINRGDDFISDSDRRLEMRAIRVDMEARTFGDIPAQIRRMTRLWDGVPGMAGLVRRRYREAQLFEDGVAASGSPAHAPVPAAPGGAEAAPSAGQTADELMERELVALKAADPAATAA